LRPDTRWGLEVPVPVPVPEVNLGLLLTVLVKLVDWE
jgi:hypothetical protein